MAYFLGFGGAVPFGTTCVLVPFKRPFIFIIETPLILLLIQSSADGGRGRGPFMEGGIGDDFRRI